MVKNADGIRMVCEFTSYPDKNGYPDLSSPNKCMNWAVQMVAYRGNEKPTYYCSKHKK